MTMTMTMTMTMKKDIILFFLLIAAFAGGGSGLFFGAKDVSAQESQIVVEPAKFDLKAKPGETIKNAFMVINRSNLSVNLEVLTKAYKTDQAGKIEFYDSEGDGMQKWLVPEFVKVTLKPLESKEIEFFVAVPQMINSGGYYGAMLLQRLDQKSAGPKNPFGALVLLTVVDGAGQATAGADILSFEADKFSDGEPVKFELNVKNPGNTHINLDGRVSVKNWRGKEIKNFKTGQLTVYPETAKKFSWNWNKAPFLGFYKTQIKLSNKLDGQELANASSWFIIFPWPIALFVVLPLLILAAIVVFWRKIKRIKRLVYVREKRQEA